MGRFRLPIASGLDDVTLKMVLAAEHLVAAIARVWLETSVRVHMTRQGALVRTASVALRAAVSLTLLVDHASVALQA